MKEAKKAFGVMPASMTLWQADQSYDKKGMEKYLRWLIDQGAHSLSICGSTGENIAMEMNDKKRLSNMSYGLLTAKCPCIAALAAMPRCIRSN